MHQKVYITKYALTKGIIEADAEIEKSPFDENDKYAYVTNKIINSDGIHYKNYVVLYRIGIDVFLDREDAIRDANNKREAEIKRLQKKIVKIVKLTF